MDSLRGMEGEGVSVELKAWTQPWSLVQLMTLTEAVLWSSKEAKERANADGVCLHTEVCCPICRFQHVAKTLLLAFKKKKKKLPARKGKKLAGIVPLWK